MSFYRFEGGRELSRGSLASWCSPILGPVKTKKASARSRGLNILGLVGSKHESGCWREIKTRSRINFPELEEGRKRKRRGQMDGNDEFPLSQACWSQAYVWGMLISWSVSKAVTKGTSIKYAHGLVIPQNVARREVHVLLEKTGLFLSENSSGQPCSICACTLPLSK